MYQVFARKYRPQTFADVVNQEHVKRTLANAIDQGRVGHGYIFSGPRGTGKTTMARILAMALNCADGPKSDFDPADPTCKEIAAGSAMDVIEIDAASNRRIDDIRELRESVRYRPARDRFKVFIIDEAHQITTDAFNALLKTLEEPPDWVVFVLCTTEPQAIPATIHSRCQSFQFRTVELDLVIEHLKRICAQEGIEADDDALTAVALAGDGSIRDGLSTLDQAIASCGKRLEADAVRDLLGAIPTEVTERILEALREDDPPAMLEIVDRIFAEGRHPQHFVGELTRQFRNLLVMKVAGIDTKLVAAGQDERSRAAKALDGFSQDDLTRYVQLLLDLYRDLQNAPQPRFRTELGLLKLVYAGRLTSIEEAIAGLNGGGGAQAGDGGSTRSTAPSRQAASRQAAPAASKRASEPPSVQAPPAPKASAPERPQPMESAPPAEPAPPADSPLKDRAVAALRDVGEDFMAEALAHCALKELDGVVEVEATSEDRTTLEFGWAAIEKAVRQAFGKSVRVRMGAELAAAETAAAAPASAPTEEVSPLETEVAKRALADPDVQAFQQLFPGQVREVRNLRDLTS